MLRSMLVALVLGSLACSDHSSGKMKSTDGSGGHDTGASGNGSGGHAGAAGSAAPMGTGGQTNHGSTGSGMDAGADMHDACGPVLQAPRCLQSDFCWDGPSFTGADLFAIDGTRDAKSIWAVGALGTAFRYCGGEWLPIDTGTEEHLYDVFSPTVDFAVAVGEHGTLIVWDGATWKHVDMPTDKTLRAVWGASPSDSWIGCDLGADSMADNLFHFDGRSITDSAASGTSVKAIRGRSSDDIYAVGATDLWPHTDHYDGKKWTSGMLEAGSDPGIVMQLVFATVKNRTFARFEGLSTNQIFADDSPGWVSVYYPKTRLGALYLDDENMPSVVSTPATADALMPGVAIKTTDKATDEKWMMSDEHFTAWPEEVWTGAGHDFAAGRGSALLTRGDDGVWSQVPDFDSMLGQPVAIGGSSADDGWLVSEHDVYHRDASGWKALPRIAEHIQTASIDVHGEVYIGLDGGTVRHYDGSAWHDLPGGKVSYGDVFAFAPDDVWYADQTVPAHFDGSAWTYTYELCSATNGSDLKRFRRDPSGTVWGVDALEAVQFDLDGKTCTQVTRSDAGQVDIDPLVDVAWTEDGQMWAISEFGRLYRRSGDSFEPDAMPGVDALPDGGTTTENNPRPIELLAMPGNKLRYVLGDGIVASYDSRYAAKGRLVTVDVSSGSVNPTIEDLPLIGPMWIPDATHTFIAFPGGVVRRDR